MSSLSDITELSEPIDGGDLAGAIEALLLAVDAPDGPARQAAISNAEFCATHWRKQEAEVTA